MMLSGKSALHYGAGYLAAAFFAFEAIKTPFSTRISQDSLIVTHPFFRKRIALSDITSVKLERESQVGTIPSKVRLSSRKSRRAIVLKTSVSETNNLYLAIKKAARL